jgi:hypothetical protein
MDEKIKNRGRRNCNQTEKPDQEKTRRMNLPHAWRD